MIPIHIKIKGLYSYLETQEIDFTRLIEAGLFGIFGEVGSGKSSILEAVSLCIYGKSERFNEKGDDRYYNMLNLKATEAIIEFTFIAGPTNRKYHAVYRLKRNGKKYEEVNLHEHKFYLLQEGEPPHPVDEKVVFHDIGISYDNFKRTLIIPQGQFKEFLELKPAERTAMLKELFGLHRFDLSPKVASLEKANSQRLNFMEGELQGLADATQETTEQLKQQLTETIVQIRSNEQQKQRLGKELLTLDALEKDLKELNLRRTEWETKQEVEKKDQEREKEISEYENLKNNFLLPFSILKNLREELDKLRTEEAQCKKVIESLEQTVNTTQVELQILEEQNAAADFLRQKATELEKLVQIRNLSENLGALVKKSQEIRQRGEKGSHYIADQKSLRTSVLEENEQLNASMIPEDRVLVIRNWYQELKDLQNEKERLLKMLIENENKLAEYDESIRQKRKESPAGLLAEMSVELDLTGFEAAFHRYDNSVTASINKFSEQESGLQVKKELVRFASILKNGKPCMLCGSVHHPTPLQVEAPDANILELQENLNRLKQELKQATGIRIDINNLLQGRQQLILEAENQKVQIRLKEEEILKKSAATPDPHYRAVDEASFRSTEKASIDARKKIAANHLQLQTLQSNIDKAQEKLNELSEEQSLADLERNRLQTLHDAKLEELSIVTPDLYERNSIGEIHQESIDLISQLEANVKHLKEKNQQLAELLKKQSSLSGKLESVQGSKVDMSQKLEKQQIHIAEQLEACGLDENALRNVLEKNLDVQSIRQEILLNREALNSLRGEINALQQKVADKIYDESLHQLIREEFQAAEKKFQQVMETKGTLEGQIRKMESDLSKKQLLEKQHAELSNRARDISTLKSLFSGSKFIDFVSRRYLQNVVASANVRFRKMVRQKFSMELSEKGDFVVLDYLNGGKTRLLKSLSGGQTFQAALCLALALSESIQRNAAMEQHFFFLDEGFGSLDADNLQLVLDTLKSMQQERRVVGLISHVAELHQEMDIYLSITNDNERGTLIKKSWEN